MNMALLPEEIYSAGPPVKIHPVDLEVRQRAQAVYLWNGYKAQGYIKRDAFVKIVQAYDATYLDKKQAELLKRFWVGRYISADLLLDLSNVLDQLRKDDEIVETPKALRL